MKKFAFIFLSVALAACSSGSSEYDATGMFEATEVIVSAEQNGRLLSFNVDEGDRLQAGSQVGLIDTVQLQLRALQLGATKDVYATQRPDIETQIAATRQELAKAEAEQRRYEALVKDNAANRKMLDDAVSNVRVLRRRLAAQLSSLGKSTSSLNSQMTATEIQRREVIDQLRKCHVVSPISGTVLEKYAEQGEYATTGKPLFKIADVVDMKLRAYVTASQSAQFDKDRAESQGVCRRGRGQAPRVSGRDNVDIRQGGVYSQDYTDPRRALKSRLRGEDFCKKHRRSN